MSTSPAQTQLRSTRISQTVWDEADDRKYFFQCCVHHVQKQKWLVTITYAVHILRRYETVASSNNYGKPFVKSYIYAAMFHCRWWTISHLKWWRRSWCERSWCCIQTTMRVMTTIHARLANPGVQSDGRSLCCPQYAAVGGGHSQDGQNHRLVAGSVINLESYLNVSIHAERQTLLVINLYITVHYKNRWCQCSGAIRSAILLCFVHPW